MARRKKNKPAPDEPTVDVTHDWHFWRLITNSLSAVGYDHLFDKQRRGAIAGYIREIHLRIGQRIGEDITITLRESTRQDIARLVRMDREWETLADRFLGVEPQREDSPAVTSAADQLRRLIAEGEIDA